MKATTDIRAVDIADAIRDNIIVDHDQSLIGVEDTADEIVRLLGVSDAARSEHLKEFGPAVGPADIEAEIKAKGLTGPRVTKEIIESKIASILYERVPPEFTFTICAITMRNGFVVIGESACASPENFDEEIGRKIAYANAFQKLWALEGYLLKEILAVDRAIKTAGAMVDPTDTQAAMGHPAHE